MRKSTFSTKATSVVLLVASLLCAAVAMTGTTFAGWAGSTRAEVQTAQTQITSGSWSLDVAALGAWFLLPDGVPIDINSYVLQPGESVRGVYAFGLDGDMYADHLRAKVTGVSPLAAASADAGLEIDTIVFGYHVAITISYPLGAPPPPFATVGAYLGSYLVNIEQVIDY